MTGTLPVSIKTLVIVAVVLAVLGFIFIGPKALGALLLPFLGSSKKQLIARSEGKTQAADEREQAAAQQVEEDIAAVNEAHQEAVDAAKDTEEVKNVPPGYKPRTFRSE